MRGRDLSAACFDDHCGDCAWGCCECRCHEDQEYDLLAFEWVDIDELDEV